MTRRETLRRVYLETSNAILAYLDRYREHTLSRDEEAVEDELRKSAKVFRDAADEMLNTQKAGLP